MDNLTKIIREEIDKQYKSVRQFAFAVGVPLSTVNSALHNGVGGSSFDTVLRLCRVLGIKALGDDAAVDEQVAQALAAGFLGLQRGLKLFIGDRAGGDEQVAQTHIGHKSVSFLDGGRGHSKRL